MNCSPASPFPKPGARRRARRSFTLAEAVVAIAVLSIVLALVARIVGFAGATWAEGKRRADNFTKARASLDAISRDYRMGIYRPDLPQFTVDGAYSNAFYSLCQSSGQTGERPLSLVCYQIVSGATNATLQRMAAPISWTNAVPFAQASIPTATFTNAQDMVEGVLQLDVSFVRPDGSLTNAYTPGDRAVGIGLVVVDDATLSLLVKAGKLTALLHDAAFAIPSAVSLTNTPSQIWQANLNHSPGAPHPLDYTAYPAQLGTGIRCFERHVPLP